MSKIVGTFVSLRPVAEADLPFVARASMAWATEGQTEADLLLRLQERFHGTSPFPALDYAIEIDGRLIGNVQARRDPHLAGLFELGIVVFDDADKGRGVGREALALVAAKLFRDEGAHRVQLSTDVRNAAMRRAAGAAGFAYEGVLRGFWPPTEGEPAADYVIYAMTKHDHEDVT